MIVFATPSPIQKRPTISTNCAYQGIFHNQIQYERMPKINSSLLDFPRAARMMIIGIKKKRKKKN